MHLSAEEMRKLSFSTLCREIREVGRMITFFNYTDCVPRNKQQERWWSEVKTLEDTEALEKRFLVLKLNAKNLREEILFSQKRTC